MVQEVQSLVQPPFTLLGTHVRLEPLAEEHHVGLCSVGLDLRLWQFFPYAIDSAEAMLKFIHDALDEQARGVSVPFATGELATGRVVGSTRFMNIDRKHRRVEIGATWLGLPWQRTAINTEAKLLMLQCAFGEWGCVRVELKTDALNSRSRAAIQRIGAKEEGTLRQHMVVQHGRLRDTVYYSILDSEWPAVKRDMELKLASRA